MISLMDLSNLCNKLFEDNINVYSCMTSNRTVNKKSKLKSIHTFVFVIFRNLLFFVTLSSNLLFMRTSSNSRAYKLYVDAVMARIGKDVVRESSLGTSHGP